MEAENMVVAMKKALAQRREASKNSEQMPKKHKVASKEGNLDALWESWQVSDDQPEIPMRSLLSVRKNLMACNKAIQLNMPEDALFQAIGDDQLAVLIAMHASALKAVFDTIRPLAQSVDKVVLSVSKDKDPRENIHDAIDVAVRKGDKEEIQRLLKQLADL